MTGKLSECHKLRCLECSDNKIWCKIVTAFIRVDNIYVLYLHFTDLRLGVHVLCITFIGWAKLIVGNAKPMHNVCIWRTSIQWKFQLRTPLNILDRIPEKISSTVNVQYIFFRVFMIYYSIGPYKHQSWHVHGKQRDY
jgi:hypothetical protein